MPNTRDAANAFDDSNGLLDLQRLNDWIETQNLPGSGPLTSARKLTGGVQNSVFLLERDGASLVLRRPGKHLRPGANETMLREAHILKALAGTAVPHPALYAVCADETVIGACFYVMQPLHGFAPSGALPGHYASDPSWRRAMGEELVSAAAALAALDPAAIDLANLGKPEQWHERQVSRWRSQFDGYRDTPNYDASLPHIDEVSRWLTDNLPRERRIGLIHGDFQFANVMFAHDAPRIAGVVDWELASQGDPLLDLGWILTSWLESGDPDGKRALVQPWDNFLSRSELVQRYGEISGRDMSAMPWFFALACFKLACLLEGTYARACAGQIPMNVGESVHNYATWLMNKARQLSAG